MIVVYLVHQTEAVIIAYYDLLGDACYIVCSTEWRQAYFQFPSQTNETANLD